MTLTKLDIGFVSYCIVGKISDFSSSYCAGHVSPTLASSSTEPLCARRAFRSQHRAAELRNVSTSREPRAGAGFGYDFARVRGVEPLAIYRLVWGSLPRRGHYTLGCKVATNPHARCRLPMAERCSSTVGTTVGVVVKVATTLYWRQRLVDSCARGLMTTWFKEKSGLFDGYYSTGEAPRSSVGMAANVALEKSLLLGSRCTEITLHHDVNRREGCTRYKLRRETVSSI